MLIVECIDDEFYTNNKRGKRVRAKTKMITPKKGCFYEVVGTKYVHIEGHDRLFYRLREFAHHELWHHSFFREVDLNLNIDELLEVLENQSERYKEIYV